MLIFPTEHSRFYFFFFSFFFIPDVFHISFRQEENKIKFKSFSRVAGTKVEVLCLQCFRVCLNKSRCVFARVFVYPPHNVDDDKTENFQRQKRNKLLIQFSFLFFFLLLLRRRNAAARVPLKKERNKTKILCHLRQSSGEGTEEGAHPWWMTAGPDDKLTSNVTSPYSRSPSLPHCLSTILFCCCLPFRPSAQLEKNVSVFLLHATGQ